MIVAHFHQHTDETGKKTLVGQSTNNWPLKPRTPLVLRRNGDTYELYAIDARTPHVTPESLTAFLDAELCGPPANPDSHKCS